MVLGALGAGALGGAGINIVITAIDNFSKTFGKVNKSMLLAGGAITAMGVIGVGVMKKLVDTSISFESAFTGVRKTVDLTEAEFADLNQSIKDMSSTIPVTFEELSRIGEIAGQLGVEGVDDLEKFTRTIADISVSTDLTAEAAATDFARIANIMGIPISDVDRMGSTVVDLGNNFATTEPEIVAFATRIAGAGKIVGLTTADLFGWGAAMASVGIQVEAGGTAFQRALLLVDKAVSTGSDKLELFADVSGLTTDEFVKLWEIDASSAMEKFVAGLGTKGSEAAIILGELGLGNVRTTRTFLSLSTAGDLSAEALGRAKKASEENTAATIESKKRYATAESKVKTFKNKIRDLADDLGTTLKPAFEGIIDKLGVFIDFLKEHPELTKFAVVVLAIGTALALIIGPIVLLVAILPLIAAGFGAVTAAGLPFWLIALAIIAAIAAIIAISVFLFQKWDEMSGWMKFLTFLFFPLIAAGIFLIKNWDKIKESAKKLGIFLKNIWVGIRNTVMIVWNDMIDIMQDSINKVIGIVNNIIKRMNKIKGININTISTVDFSKHKGAFDAYTTYVPPPIETATNGGGDTNINIEGSVYGTDPDEMAIAMQDKINEKITT